MTATVGFVPSRRACGNLRHSAIDGQHARNHFRAKDLREKRLRAELFHDCRHALLASGSRAHLRKFATQNSLPICSRSAVRASTRGNAWPARIVLVDTRARPS